MNTTEQNGQQPQKPKATIYQTRRECLIAKANDSRNMYVATHQENQADYYGLANTAHQFALALVRKFFVMCYVDKDRIRDMMVEELSSQSKESYEHVAIGHACLAQESRSKQNSE